MLHFDDIQRFEEPTDTLYGLLIIIPELDGHSGRDESFLAKSQILENVQESLLSKAIAYPVYFTYETAEILQWYAELEAQEVKPSDTMNGFERLFSSFVPKADEDRQQVVSVRPAGKEKVLDELYLDAIYVSCHQMLITICFRAKKTSVQRISL